MTHPLNIVWFRRDLRLDDNPALTAATEGGAPVLPLFVEESGERDPWRPAAPARARERVALARLNAELLRRGSRLQTGRGSTVEILDAICSQHGVQAVYWNRRHEPFERELEHEVVELLRQRGIAARPHEGNLLFPPTELASATGSPYRVFTPFWRACLMRTHQMGAALDAPERLQAPEEWPRMQELDLPTATETGEQLSGLAERVTDYAENRDRPDRDGTSRLSASLHLGEIGPRRLWQTIDPMGGDGAEAFQRQLAWREFAQHLLHHFPETPQRPMRRAFEQFPWRDDDDAFALWKQGRVGYPIVDAGMRQLASEGWMHNRVRMITASFLVKHLLIDWREGARHFWNTLGDADLANNTMGWQWVAGCGVDASPYFRVFNPQLQGQRFDPHGDYVRRWIPELARMPERWIHRPWAAPASSAPAVDYPTPVIELASGRRRALDAYAELAR